MNARTVGVMFEVETEPPTLMPPPLLPRVCESPSGLSVARTVTLPLTLMLRFGLM